MATVLYEGAWPFELAVPCEVFGVDRSDLAASWYRHRVCAAEPPPVRSAAGFTIDTPYGLDEIRRADTVIIPAWRDPAAPVPDALLDALVTAHRRGARLMSVCTGAFVLAAAGLLDGRPATTHWYHARELAERFPTVRVDPSVLYIDDGDILTSAGTAAGVDLCLHVVRRDHGASVANSVARRMVVPPHRDGGQAQYVEAPIAAAQGADPIAAVLGWALEHLHQPLTVERLARRAAMSPRTFARRFRAVTGTTPHQWLVGQRILMAQHLLEAGDDAVEAIAARCGFGSSAGMRLHFQRALSTSPQAYRRLFRSPPPSRAGR